MRKKVQNRRRRRTNRKTTADSSFVWSQSVVSQIVPTNSIPAFVCSHPWETPPATWLPGCSRTPPDQNFVLQRRGHWALNQKVFRVRRKVSKNLEQTTHQWTKPVYKRRSRGLAGVSKTGQAVKKNVFGELEGPFTMNTRQAVYTRRPYAADLLIHWSWLLPSTSQIFLFCRAYLLPFHFHFHFHFQTPQS